MANSKLRKILYSIPIQVRSSTIKPIQASVPPPPLCSPRLQPPIWVLVIGCSLELGCRNLDVPSIPHPCHCIFSNQFQPVPATPLPPERFSNMTALLPCKNNAK